MGRYIDAYNIYVVSDFCCGGNLYYLQKTMRHFNDIHLRFIAVQLIAAIHYLHDKGCLFCGLLAENVLLDQQGFVQLTGFSRMETDIAYPYYKMVGYMEFMPPEMLLNKGITQAYDWYMLGCLLYGRLRSSPHLKSSLRARSRSRERPRR